MNECVRCGELYRDEENVGAYTCRYHAQPLLDYATPEADARVYACCGASPDPLHPAYGGEEAARGCRRAHHRRARHRALAVGERDVDARIRLPLTRALELLDERTLAAESMFVDADAGTVTIERHERRDGVTERRL